ncbi:glycosyltransferase family 4 protein [Providencia sp. PROV036]|uniref:glycosyltransferase family 4 protein n=1 Tax=Providencia sp. PROV036 TaxID=2949767 RepID=UPI00234B7A07|nr:glycosyltransferase family 4 protein [Providencia sp. PROV036]
MNIALVSQNVSPGHLIFRRDLIKNLVKEGHTVYAFAIDYTNSTENAIIKLGAIPIRYTLQRTGLNPLKDFATIFQLTQLFKEYQIDSVFSFFIKPSMYGTLAAKFAKCSIKIAMIEGLGFIHTPSASGETFKKKLLKIVHGLLASLTYAYADKILFLNPDDPKDLKKFTLLNKDKIEVFGPIGLNLENYPYQKVKIDKTIRFIFIARLLREKGIFEYIAAAEKIKSKYNNVEFVVLGGLDEENPGGIKLNQLKELVNNNTIIYPGFVDNIPRWISSAHVFVLPSSYREGVPRSTQEAMAIGRAIITTNVPGCKETVKDGYNGFLVSKWNVDELVIAMENFLLNPTLIETMGDASYKIAVNNFDEKKITPRLVQHITQL